MVKVLYIIIREYILFIVNIFIVKVWEIMIKIKFINMSMVFNLFYIIKNVGYIIVGIFL